MNLDILACPRDRTKLSRRSPDRLVCEHGHVYPVVDDVPVLLLDDVEQSIDVARSSLARANGAIDEPMPELYLESVGVSDKQKALAVDLAASRAPKVDPVVSVLIGATNGFAYNSLVGRLPDYPIPALRLPPARGRLLLDVGCSWGRWSIAAARKGYRVVGIDPSLGAVMAARRVARQLDTPIDYVCGDARYLPFCAGAFDTVFSYSVIQHFSKADARRTLAEIGRVLAESGDCLVQMPNRSGLRSLYHRARRNFSEGSGFDVRYWTLDELRVAFDEAIGPSSLSVHCYFGLGLEPGDMHLMRRSVKVAIVVSEFLRRLSEKAPILIRLADSVYVSAAKAQ